MKSKVSQLIKKYSMLFSGDQLVVGFSGGADSTALLHLLYQMKIELNIKLSAAHLNHQHRGRESDGDEAFCREFCEKLGIPLTVKKVDIATLAKDRKQSVELVARGERYLFFEQFKDCKIATAHNLDDNAETILLNLTRGTGLDGLTGIPPVRGNILRPMLTCTREEVENYLEENCQEYRIDSTNLGDDYTRNKLRHKVVPVLKEINPALLETVYRMGKILEEDRNYLNSLAEDNYQKLKIGNSFLIEEFSKLPKPIAFRVLRSIFGSLDIAVSGKKLGEVYDKIVLCESGHQLTKEYSLFCSSEYFEVKALRSIKKPRDYFEKAFYKGNFAESNFEVYEGKTIVVKTAECKEIENIEKNYPERLKNLLDYDKIGLNINFRQRKSGDYFTPVGRGVTKSFKKLFNEAGLSALSRSEAVLLESQGEIIWAEAFGVSASTAVSKETKKALEITVN